MLKVIKTSTDEGAEIVSEVLDFAQERIKEGDIVAVAITFLTKGRGQEWSTGGIYSQSEMIGALELTKANVIQEDRD